MKAYTTLSYLCLFLFFSCLHAQLLAQSIKVGPYLQNAQPNSIYIMWETTSGEESLVEWGATEALGNTTIGTAFNSVGDAFIHEVQLTGLTKFTTYYYRVNTGDASSEIHRFKTPPFAQDHESFRLLAMSDMQRDFFQPSKFEEVVEEGVIDFLNETVGGELSDQLGFIMIPGDLVVTGTVYSQWEDHFFGPAQPLLTDVPLYPVPGNHEYDTQYYYDYFHLPDNGNPDVPEHYYHHDYGNVRIIGLDSNGPYNNEDQLNWLENVLEITCELDSIDFVFAQLHHPHKSELWTPGESDFTGEVIALLEQFTEGCGKPSIHFFGHTHGYSRGQSRDHKHLMVNVASAGGATDTWGDFPTADYPEYSVSHDDYGFVTVEVTAGDDPQFLLRRISRGNEDQGLDNVIRDSILIKRYGTAVDQPLGLSPMLSTIPPECVTLMASPFSSSTANALHGESHWQVAENCSGFDAPLVERWQQYQNWFYEEDTQAGYDLTQEEIAGLDANTDYCWRVRFRDRNLEWSNWSESYSFSTGDPLSSANLLSNSDAETGDISDWNITLATIEALSDGECDGISPYQGTYYFAVGGVCDGESDLGKAVQNMDVSTYSSQIDSADYQVNYGGFLSSYSGSDEPSLKLFFLDEAGSKIDSTTSIGSSSSNWTLVEEWTPIPAFTRNLQLELTGKRNAGSDNDSYFDQLFVRIAPTSINCSDIVSVETPNLPLSAQLLAIPNPTSTKTMIKLPFLPQDAVNLRILNAAGQQINPPVEQNGHQLEVNVRALSSGVYFFSAYDQNQMIGKGRFIVR